MWCFVCSSQEVEEGSHRSGGGPPIPVLSSAPGHTAGTASWEGAKPNTSSLNCCSTLCVHWIYGTVAYIMQEDCCAHRRHASIVLYPVQFCITARHFLLPSCHILQYLTSFLGKKKSFCIHSHVAIHNCAYLEQEQSCTWIKERSQICKNTIYCSNWCTLL